MESMDYRMECMNDRMAYRIVHASPHAWRAVIPEGPEENLVVLEALKAVPGISEHNVLPVDLICVQEGSCES